MSDPLRSLIKINQELEDIWKQIHDTEDAITSLKTSIASLRVSLASLQTELKDYQLHNFPLTLAAVETFAAQHVIPSPKAFITAVTAQLKLLQASETTSLRFRVTTTDQELTAKQNDLIDQTEKLRLLKIANNKVTKAREGILGAALASLAKMESQHARSEKTILRTYEIIGDRLPTSKDTDSPPPERAPAQ